MDLGQAVPGQAVRGQAALKEWAEALQALAAAPPPSSLGALLGGALWVEYLPAAHR